MPRVVSHLSHSIIRIPTFCSLLFVWSLNFFLGKDWRFRWNLRSSSFASQDMGQNTQWKYLDGANVAKETPPKNPWQIAPWQWFVISWGKNPSLLHKTLPWWGRHEVMKLETTRVCRIQLNQPIHGTLETIVECKSADGRRRMGTVEAAVGWSLVLG